MTNQLRLCLAKLGHFTIILCTLSEDMVEPIGLEQDSSKTRANSPMFVLYVLLIQVMLMVFYLCVCGVMRGANMLFLVCMCGHDKRFCVHE